jgi:hypothetical protein
MSRVEKPSFRIGGVGLKGLSSVLIVVLAPLYAVGVSWELRERKREVANPLSLIRVILKA